MLRAELVHVCLGIWTADRRLPDAYQLPMQVMGVLSDATGQRGVASLRFGYVGHK